MKVVFSILLLFVSSFASADYCSLPTVSCRNGHTLYGCQIDCGSGVSAHCQRGNCGGDHFYAGGAFGYRDHWCYCGGRYRYDTGSDSAETLSTEDQSQAQPEYIAE